MQRWVVIYLVLMVSCSDGDDVAQGPTPELEGVWELVEQYADPGDGSGDFKKVDSDKIIEFFEDGVLSSNGELCGLESASGVKAYGTYVVNDSLNKFSIDNYILPEDCDNFENYKIFFHLEGQHLILSYPCIEGCGQKYRKQ